MPTTAERLVALETQMVNSIGERGELWRAFHAHETVDDARFGEIRRILLGRPSWAVTTYLAVTTAALTGTLSALVTFLVTHR